VPGALYGRGVYDNHGAGVVGLLQNPLNARQGFNVEHLRADWDEHQIGDGGGLNAGLGGFARGIHYHEIEALLWHCRQNVFQPGRHARNHFRVVALATVAPIRGGRLLVKVNHKGFVLLLSSKNGKGKGNCGFAVAAFLPDDSYFSHNQFL
jgi:hypothetical protein